MTRRLATLAAVLGAVLLCLAPLAHPQPKPVVVVQSGERPRSTGTCTATRTPMSRIARSSTRCCAAISRRSSSRQPGGVVAGGQRDHLAVQAEAQREVPQRRALRRRGGEVQRRAHAGPEAGRPGRTSIATIDHVDVVDPYTVNVITKAPFPLLAVRMSRATAAPSASCRPSTSPRW